MKTRETYATLGDITKGLAAELKGEKAEDETIGELQVNYGRDSSSASKLLMQHKTFKCQKKVKVKLHRGACDLLTTAQRVDTDNRKK